MSGEQEKKELFALLFFSFSLAADESILSHFSCLILAAGDHLQWIGLVRMQLVETTQATSVRQVEKLSSA